MSCLTQLSTLHYIICIPNVICPIKKSTLTSAHFANSHLRNFLFVHSNQQPSSETCKKAKNTANTLQPFTNIYIKPTTHHIWIIPMSRSGVRHNHILVIAVVIDDALHTRPRILDVVEVPPQIAVVDDGGEVRLHPRVDLIHRPTAGVDHRPAGAVEMEAEFGVAPVHFGGVRVAAVQFYVVDVP